MACRTIFGLLTLVFLFAVAGYGVSTLGSLDLPTDRPAAIVLIVLGLPWVLAPLDMVVGQTYWPIVAVAAPIANLFILRFVCQRTTA